MTASARWESVPPPGGRAPGSFVATPNTIARRRLREIRASSPFILLIILDPWQERERLEHPRGPRVATYVVGPNLRMYLSSRWSTLPIEQAHGEQIHLKVGSIGWTQ